MFVSGNRGGRGYTLLAEESITPALHDTWENFLAHKMEKFHTLPKVRNSYLTQVILPIDDIVLMKSEPDVRKPVFRISSQV